MTSPSPALSLAIAITRARAALADSRAEAARRANNEAAQSFLRAPIRCMTGNTFRQS